jgi:hypothetical protein
MAIGGEEAVGSEDMEVGVEDEVVAEGVDCGDGSEFPVGEVEAGAECVAEGFGGGVEEAGEEVAALAKNAAEDARDGEDKLAVRDFVADGGGDPVAGGADAALVAGRAEVSALASEGEEAFVAAVWALEAGGASRPCHAHGHGHAEASGRVTADPGAGPGQAAAMEAALLECMKAIHDAQVERAVAEGFKEEDFRPRR